MWSGFVDLASSRDIYEKVQCCMVGLIARSHWLSKLSLQGIMQRKWKGGIADALMLLLSGTSIVVSLILTVFMVFNTKNREIEQSHEVDGRGMEDCWINILTTHHKKL